MAEYGQWVQNFNKSIIKFEATDNNQIFYKSFVIVYNHFIKFQLKTMSAKFRSLWNSWKELSTTTNSMVSFRMAGGNVELMHECYNKHMGMGTARKIHIGRM